MKCGFFATIVVSMQPMFLLISYKSVAYLSNLT